MRHECESREFEDDGEYLGDTVQLLSEGSGSGRSCLVMVSVRESFLREIGAGSALIFFLLIRIDSLPKSEGDA